MADCTFLYTSAYWIVTKKCYAVETWAVLSKIAGGRGINRFFFRDGGWGWGMGVGGDDGNKGVVVS